MQEQGAQRRAAAAGGDAVEVLLSGPAGAPYAEWQFRARAVRARWLPSLAMGDPRLLLQHAAAPTTFFEILTGTPLQPMYRQHLSDASRVEILGRGRAVWAPVSPGRVRVLRFVVPFQSGTQPEFRAYRFDPHVAGAGALQVVAQHPFAM